MHDPQVACIICRDRKPCPDPVGMGRNHRLSGTQGAEKVVWHYRQRFKCKYKNPPTSGSGPTNVDLCSRYLILWCRDLLSRSGTITLSTLVNPLHGGPKMDNLKVPLRTWECITPSNSTANAELLSREHIYFVPRSCQLSLPGFMRLATLEAQKYKCSSCKTSINMLRFDFDF